MLCRTCVIVYMCVCVLCVYSVLMVVYGINMCYCVCVYSVLMVDMTRTKPRVLVTVTMSYNIQIVCCVYCIVCIGV